MNMNRDINPFLPAENSNKGGKPNINSIGNQPTDLFGTSGYPFQDPDRMQFGNRDMQMQELSKPYELYDQSFDYGVDRGRWKRAYARIVHLSPNTPSIDIYLDGRLFYSGLNYKMQTDYVGVRPGNHRIVFYSAGQISNPIFIKTLFVPRRSIVSFVVYGLLPNIDVMVVDDKTTIPQGRVKVKFVHLSPNTPAIDLLAGRSVWFTQVMYQEATEYIPVTSGHEILSLRRSGTQQIILSMPNVQFVRNRAYTIYAIGLTGASPPLQLLMIQDGSGKLQVD